MVSKLLAAGVATNAADAAGLTALHIAAQVPRCLADRPHPPQTLPTTLYPSLLLKNCVDIG